MSWLRKRDPDAARLAWVLGGLLREFLALSLERAASALLRCAQRGFETADRLSERPGDRALREVVEAGAVIGPLDSPRAGGHPSRRPGPRIHRRPRPGLPVRNPLA